MDWAVEGLADALGKRSRHNSERLLDIGAPEIIITRS
jgi:hypothetical protein